MLPGRIKTDTLIPLFPGSKSMREGDHYYYSMNSLKILHGGNKKARATGKGLAIHDTAPLLFTVGCTQVSQIAECYSTSVSRHLINPIHHICLEGDSLIQWHLHLRSLHNVSYHPHGKSPGTPILLTNYDPIICRERQHKVSGSNTTRMLCKSLQVSVSSLGESGRVSKHVCKSCTILFSTSWNE